MTEQVIYLVQYEYVDEPGSFWPARAFPCVEQAEQWATQKSTNVRDTKRIYSVTPLFLEAPREKPRTTRKRSRSNSQPALF